MNSPIKRRYSSPLREEGARRTGELILAAAQELFIAQGYVQTTIDQIAERAGVSRPTVFANAGSKRELLKRLRDLALAGDDEPVPMLQRPGLGRVRDEPDARAKLRLYGEFLAEVAARHVPVQLVIRDAAASDPEAQALWAELQAERLKGMTLFARALYDDGHLRPGVSPREARDVLWTYNSAELFQLLVIERGWSPKRYGRWVADALTSALLPPSGGPETG